MLFFIANNYSVFDAQLPCLDKHTRALNITNQYKNSCLFKTLQILFLSNC